jgi:hypothetical protein
MKNKIKILLFLTLIFVSVYFCLRYPSDISFSIVSSLNRCLNLIIPSMFIFMCLTSIIINSRLHKIIGIPFKFISEKVFHLPKEGFAVFLLSMIAGYPAGIKLVSDSFKNGDITFEQARKMNCFCFSSGPAFISGTAAGVLYPHSNAGIIIFISVITGNIILALILSLRCGEALKKIPPQKFSLNSKCIVPSVKSASSAMMQMCVMIVAFGEFCCILKLTGIIQFLSFYVEKILNVKSQYVYDLIMSFLEISNIVNLPVMNTQLLPIVTALLSFGGICVLLQIIAISDDTFVVKDFVNSRFISAVISGITCKILMRFLNINTSIETISYQITSEKQYSLFPVLMLIIMILLLLGTFNDSGKKRKKPPMEF